MPMASFLTLGTTPTQAARASRSWGMPLSGVSMMAWKTAWACFRRSSCFSDPHTVAASRSIPAVIAMLASLCISHLRHAAGWRPAEPATADYRGTRQQLPGLFLVEQPGSEFKMVGLGELQRQNGDASGAAGM